MAKRAIKKRGVATVEGLETIAQRLVRLRKERGLTQAQMAKRLGVSQPVVSDYERGGLRLHGELILRVAEILDVSANELLGLAKAAPKKRGPQSQLERQMAAIASLPRKEQQQLLAVVEAFISQHATQ